MPIPNFQNYFLPVLKIISDKQEHTVQELIEKVANEFSLSEEDKKELLPSGKDYRHSNRVKWTKTYLKKAGLLESTGRSKVEITQEGLDLLSENPSKIDIKFLKRYPSFIEFAVGNKSEATDDQVSSYSNDISPEESLEQSYNNLREKLSIELLEKVKSCSPKFFESLVVDLLLAMGYGGSRRDAGEAIGSSGDGGIDGIIKEDKLGLDAIYIQAKRWESTVGRPVVQAFAGSLMGKKAHKGVMITTSSFSSDARSYVKDIDKKIVLIDGATLAKYMIDHDIGVFTASTYSVKRMDLDYFEDEV